MVPAQLDQCLDDRRRRGVRRMRGATGSIDEPGRTGGLVAVNPFIGRLSADAESPRQVRHVEHVALIIRDELHALIHE